MTTMKDFMGTEIHVGDRVIGAHSDYQKLLTGTVIKLCPVLLRVQWDREHLESWEKDNELRDPGACIVITSHRVTE